MRTTQHVVIIDVKDSTHIGVRNKTKTQKSHRLQFATAKRELNQRGSVEFSVETW